MGMKFNRKYFFVFFSLLNCAVLADNSKTYIYCVKNSSFKNYGEAIAIRTVLMDEGIFNDSQPSRNTSLYDSTFIGSATNYSIYYVTPSSAELNVLDLFESQGYLIKLKVGEAGVWTTLNNPPSDYQTVWDIQRATNTFSVTIST